MKKTEKFETERWRKNKNSLLRWGEAGCLMDVLRCYGPAIWVR